MSRIGKLPVSIPSGVTITVDNDNLVTVKSSKGELCQKIAPEMIIDQKDGVLTVCRPNDEKRMRALHGLSRTLINNMVVGLTAGYEKRLDIVGVGYRAAMQGTTLVLNMGYSHPVEMPAPSGITIEVPTQTKVIVKGVDKQAVGQFAAQVRGVREPEPYKGKGIKYETEIIRRKEGKTGK